MGRGGRWNKRSCSDDEVRRRVGRENERRSRRRRLLSDGGERRGIEPRVRTRVHRHLGACGRGWAQSKADSEERRKRRVAPATRQLAPKKNEERTREGEEHKASQTSIVSFLGFAYQQPCSLDGLRPLQGCKEITLR